MKKIVVMLAIIGWFMAFGPVCQAYTQLPELKDLVGKADLIIKGKVKSRVELGKSGTDVLIKLWVIPEKAWKGTAPATGTVQVFAFETAKEKVALVEDALPAVPAKDAVVLLFLAKKDGAYAPVTGHGALYQIDKTGMLTPTALFSVDQLEEAVKAGKK